MARRTLNRKDLRADFEAAERRKQSDDEVDEEEEEVGEEEDEDEEDESDEEADEADEAGEEVESEEEAPRKRKSAVKEPKPKEPKPRKSRARAAKTVRMKVVWGVFNNSNQRVAVYDFPKKKEADDHAAKLMADKKSTHFVQPVKEPIEEKKAES